MHGTRTALAVALGLLLTVSGAAGTHANAAPPDPVAQPQTVSADGSKITGYRVDSSRSVTLDVYSAAMHNIFPIAVQRPVDTSRPRPALYLLNGGGGGQDDASWQQRTDILKFLSDKDVNVIQPIGGRWSYYTDWRAPDPTLGTNMWKTFLTVELPPIIDGALGTNGVNAIAGLSMSGTSVLQLPIARPGLYRAVAAYSGCAQISDPIGQTFVRLAVEQWGGGDTLNMYGAAGDPMWADNDPYLHADRLRGLRLFLSSGTGAAGPFDVLNGAYAQPGESGLFSQLMLGGLVEAGVDYCTHNLAARLAALRIPATVDFQRDGTHSWGYWRREFKKSWPVLAAGLGLAP